MFNATTRRWKSNRLIPLVPTSNISFKTSTFSHQTFLYNFQRIQLLYRPPIGEHMEDLAIHEAAVASLNNNVGGTTTNVPAEDPPPKYTPPPSYTTATGARIAKFLRQSIRRSVRRIANVLGESSGSRQGHSQTQAATVQVSVWIWCV